MADKARAASAYRAAHARGAVGRVGVALVRTAALARTGVVIAAREVEVVELHSCQWRAGDGGVVVCAAALPEDDTPSRTKKMEHKVRWQAGEEGCGEPLQLVVVQREALERR